MSDAPIIVEDYCIACEGPCSNEDPEDYDHLRVEWENLAGAWQDRGVSPNAIWSFIAAVTLDVARDNDMEWEDLEEVLHLAWQNSEPDEES